MFSGVFDVLGGLFSPDSRFAYDLRSLVLGFSNNLFGFGFCIGAGFCGHAGIFQTFGNAFSPVSQNVGNGDKNPLPQDDEDQQEVDDLDNNKA